MNATVSETSLTDALVSSQMGVISPPPSPFSPTFSFFPIKTLMILKHVC